MPDPARPSSGLPTGPSDGIDLLLSEPDLMNRIMAVRAWILALTPAEVTGATFLPGIAERLNGLFIPVDRVTTAIDVLHSEYSGIGWIWTRDAGPTFRLFPHGDESAAIYARSPFAHVHKTGEWLLLDVPNTPDERFGVVPELKEAGFLSYLCIPLRFGDGSENGLTFASRTEGAFDARALAILRFLVPTLGATMEMRALSRRLDNVLRIYVGDEPHRQILSGAIRRGQVSRIRSAILFADMRSYTRITSVLTPEAAVELLNTFFDCLVPPIEQEGGEVLKYLGDGLLAIFRDKGDDTGGSAGSALAAAIQGLVNLDTANREQRFPLRIEAGIALHHGEAAYGNVGSGVRLDFTVIGPDVNLASRLAAMNKVLGEPLLMSRAFADHLWGDPEFIGHHAVDGLVEPIAIFRLRADGNGPANPDGPASPGGAAGRGGVRDDLQPA